MSVYYQVIIWFVFFAALSTMLPIKRTEVVLGEKVSRYVPIWAFIGACPILTYATMRQNVGDTNAYKEMWFELPSALSGISTYMQNVTKDRGFFLVSSVIKSTLTTNVTVYFFLIALVQIALLVYVYRKYSSNYLISIFLFIASTDYISWMFNGIRQFLAVVLTFVTCGLLLRKKYVPVIIIILLASTIHGTALIMIPFIFIVQGKAWNKKTLLFIIAVILAVAFVGQFTDILDTMLQETQYENVVSDWKEWEDDGTNLIRVLVYSVPAILSLIGLRYVKSENDPLINMSINMSIVSAGLYVVSMFTSGIFIGRLPIYFSLYSYILLPWEIDHFFTKQSVALVKGVMVVAYLVFYYIGLSALGL